MSQPPPETSVRVDLAIEPALAPEFDTTRLEALVGSIVRRELPPGEYAISLHVVGDETIRALNAEHRGKDAHTDVLSFPLHDPNGMRFVLPPGMPAHLGDVVVSYPRAQEQARDFGHSLEREIGYLVAHGVLHVLGYDHEQEADRRRMRQQEEAALAPLGLTR
jgi:probable rRNA maturation factor